ncbi:hypothetical protein NVP1244A_089 [Vibrio phage 1.244.A._10N.261.54.C3]|nr:hypothetical protein NVP1244A_089 [Vibrio phage 1.244.A._10N.261.54.C3]AUR98717.1 hypothetical protein NVP1255O_089 [Vibrio phage 1.255.O._10N.286.45.F1]
MAKKYPELTHDRLNELTAKWIVNNMNMGLVFVEHKTVTSREIPDVFGLRDGGSTTVCFEIKAHRSDFLGDKNKPHRQDPSKGVGDYRFYVAPKGIIKKSELPPKWGLLEVTPSGRFLKTHVPHDLQCLYAQTSKQHHKWVINNIKEAYDRSHNWRRSPIMAARGLVENQRWLFTEKDQAHEQRLLFAAMRQQVIASQQGIDVKCSIIFSRPFANVPQTECKHRR